MRVERKTLEASLPDRLIVDGKRVADMTQAELLGLCCAQHAMLKEAAENRGRIQLVPIQDMTPQDSSLGGILAFAGLFIAVGFVLGRLV